jgi:hypothetical protein
MKPNLLKTLIVAALSMAANTGLIYAQGSASTVVLWRTNTALLQAGDSWEPLPQDLTMPGDIKVFTNGTFQINDGKPRQLNEGQMLRGDGNLINADGSTAPVFDHIAMKGGVVEVKDGEERRLGGALTLPEGTTIQPNGEFVRPNGRSARLRDGQYITADGSGQLSGLDTITFKDGTVRIFKAGILIQMNAPNVIMGMFDGSRITAQGSLTRNDGSSRQLADGEMVILPGVVADW